MTENTYKNWNAQMMHNLPLRIFWEFWAYWAVVYYAIVVIYVGIKMGSNSQRFSFYFIYAIALLFANYIIPHIISYFYHRKRPFAEFGYKPVGWYRLFSNLKHTENSMPSEHSSSSLALSLVLLFYAPTIGLVGVLVSLWVGIGRVMLGFHYPSDVAVGYLVGIISAALALTILFI